MDEDLYVFEVEKYELWMNSLNVEMEILILDKVLKYSRLNAYMVPFAVSPGEGIPG